MVKENNVDVLCEFCNLESIRWYNLHISATRTSGPVMKFWSLVSCNFKLSLLKMITQISSTIQIHMLRCYRASIWNRRFRYHTFSPEFGNMSLCDIQKNFSFSWNVERIDKLSLAHVSIVTLISSIKWQIIFKINTHLQASNGLTATCKRLHPPLSAVSQLKITICSPPNKQFLVWYLEDN
jgi:hypothetical protein